MDIEKLPATDVLHAQDLSQGPLIFVVLVAPQHGQAAALDYLPHLRHLPSLHCHFRPLWETSLPELSAL